MKIQVIGTASEHVKDGKKDYHKLTVTFKNLESGKIEVKNLMSFGTQKEVFERLTDSKECFSVDTEKDAKGYWQWTALHRIDEAPPADAPRFDKPAAAKSNTSALRQSECSGA